MNEHPTLIDVSDFLLGRLDPDRSRDIDAHLNDCPQCRAAIPISGTPDRPQVAAPDLPPGYTFIEELGRGGMGVVYRVRRVIDDTEVVLKTPLPEHRANPVAAAALQRELDMTAQIQSEHVLHGARFHTHSDTDPTPFLEFPWISGTSLARMIGTPLARELPLRLVKWVVQACRAVEAAHRLNPPILHFDLKPENILITHEDRRALLIDFGLASPWPPPEGEPPPRGGTPAYMAPELADESRANQIGPATDVFAIGGILCAILTGHPPYSREDFPGPDATREAARRADLAPALRRLGACRDFPQLVALIRRCLDADPTRRPADAGDVRLALERLLRPSHRRRFLIAATAVVGTAVTGGALT